MGLRGTISQVLRVTHSSALVPNHQGARHMFVGDKTWVVKIRTVAGQCKGRLKWNEIFLFLLFFLPYATFSKQSGRRLRTREKTKSSGCGPVQVVVQDTQTSFPSFTFLVHHCVPRVQANAQYSTRTSRSLL